MWTLTFFYFELTLNTEYWRSMQGNEFIFIWRGQRSKKEGNMQMCDNNESDWKNWIVWDRKILRISLISIRLKFTE